MNDENEKKDDSGNETGAGEGEQEEEPQIFYDKTKSFFDNISCEAVERSKGWVFHVWCEVTHSSCCIRRNNSSSMEVCELCQ